MKDSKILLVTGASSDIGKDVIDSLGDNYTKVIAHYSNSYDELSGLINKFGEKLVPVKADFLSPDSIDAMMDMIKENNMMPDHIVHLSAPKAYNSNFHKDNINNLHNGYLVSVESISRILLKCIPYMSKQKYGRVIFMLSAYVVDLPAKYQTFYIMNKYALLGMMKSMANEYADKNIHFNGISPSMIETRFLSGIQEFIIQDNAIKNPMGRNLSVSDVTPTIKYLLSDEADCVTGINIPITGGSV